MPGAGEDTESGYHSQSGAEQEEQHILWKLAIH